MKIQFHLPEDSTPKIERPVKKEISIEFRSIVKSIDIDLGRPKEECNICRKITIERPKKEIQVLKKEENKVIEIISVEKRLDEKDRVVKEMVESLGKSRHVELNMVIISDNKKHNDNDVVEFPTIEVDENRRIKIVTNEENQEFQTGFEDDPVIVIPKIMDVEKPEQTEEELFEEKIHEKNHIEEAEDEQMLGDDFTLKAVLGISLRRRKAQSFKKEEKF
jgi:hypothetical protein